MAILRAVKMWDRSSMNAFDEITAFVVAGVHRKVLNSGLISHKQHCLVTHV